jgi:hypothetical protein
MQKNSFLRVARDRWLALLLVIAVLFLLFFPLIGLITSYVAQDFSFLSAIYQTCLALSVGLVFSLFLLMTSRDELRRPLSLAMIAGTVFGVYLGSIYNLPHYMGLLLIFGIFGLFIPSLEPLSFWLALVAVLLSLLLYALIAFLITWRTGKIQQGLWGALLTAFVALVIADCTFVLIAFVQAFPIHSQSMVLNLIQFGLLPLQTLPLSITQFVHAVMSGLIASAVAERFLRKRG